MSRILKKKRKRLSRVRKRDCPGGKKGNSTTEGLRKENCMPGQKEKATRKDPEDQTRNDVGVVLAAIHDGEERRAWSLF